MAEVEIDGVRLAFDDEGEANPPFVFVHGLACDRRAWRPQVEALSPTHRCISIDLRGRGESQPIPPFGIERATEDVAGVIRSLALPPVIVAGHSLGGLIALLLNYRHSDLVTGVVIADTPLARAASGGLAELADRIHTEGTATALGTAVENWFVSSTPEPVRDYVRDVVLGCPADVAAGMLEDGEIFERDIVSLLKAADEKPFMALWPTRPAGNPEKLRDLTVFLRQEPIPDSGHFLQLEHPLVTTALLRAFVDDVERDPRLARHR